MYGSRARGTEHKASDIDIAIKCSDAYPVPFSMIREALQASHIPYKIDLIDLNKIGEALRKKIEKEGIVIWEN